MRSVHSLTRRTGITAAVVALAGIGLVAAPSASAVPAFNADCGGSNSTDSVTLSPGDTFDVTNTNGSENCETSAQNVLATPLPNGGIILPSGLSGDVQTFTIKSNATPGSTYTVKWSKLVNSVRLGLTLTITIPGGGGGGGGDAAEPESVPVAMSLSLGASAGGAVCAEGSFEQGMSGQWMRLPAQGDCSLPSRPGAKLLGWSTSASFPVAIAQRQADHKWGTYEMVDADGTVTAIFVPAGWGVFVTSANDLYPVWSA